MSAHVPSAGLQAITSEEHAADVPCITPTLPRTASIVAWTTKMWYAVRIVMEQRRRMGIDATYTSRCWAPSDRSAALSERQQFMAGFVFRTAVAAMPSLPDSDTASVESKGSAGDADDNGSGSGNEDGQAQ